MTIKDLHFEISEEWDTEAKASCSTYLNIPLIAAFDFPLHGAAVTHEVVSYKNGKFILKNPTADRPIGH